MTTLQLRGIAVRDVSETVSSASDAASQGKFGEIDARIDMIYESNTGSYSNEIAKWILNVYKDPTYSVQTFTLKATGVLRTCWNRSDGNLEIRSRLVR